MTKCKSKPFDGSIQSEIVSIVQMEMNPVDFYLAWDLPGAVAAQILGVCERTLWGYNHRTAPVPIRRTAALFTKIWLLEGKTPVCPQLIPLVCWTSDKRLIANS